MLLAGPGRISNLLPTYLPTYLLPWSGCIHHSSHSLLALSFCLRSEACGLQNFNIDIQQTLNNHANPTLSSLDSPTITSHPQIPKCLPLSSRSPLRHSLPPPSSSTASSRISRCPIISVNGMIQCLPLHSFRSFTPRIQMRHYRRPRRLRRRRPPPQ